ncbi:MAG: MotA/TolQ/ExbB proton channel family protein [Proteobacteria bacterium]|nr:MotA/TolQ/ExbB proton channel family protein [Pseudomonadota bacterium]
MRTPFTKIIFCTVIWIFYFLNSISAQDMRAEYMESDKEKQALFEKARREAEQAKEEAEIRHQKIVSDRSLLINAIKDLETNNKTLEQEITGLEERIAIVKKEESELRFSLSETEAANKELAGFIRGNAKDLSVVLNQSLQSALTMNRGDFLKPLIDQTGVTGFPSMDDIKQMVDLLFDEIRRSGEVRLTQGMIIDREGHETQARLLVLGNFSAVYEMEDETGFLLYSDQSERLFALSRLPGRGIVKQNEAYINGKTDGVYLDISKGGALRQLTHKLSLIEQVPKGGPIVWPILAILGVAVLIVIERIIFLFRRKIDADSFTQGICRRVVKGEWAQCLTLCENEKNKSVPRVLKAGVECRGMDRIDMENALQESIISQIPYLERFMSTLGMLAAIAPLLGLLGTVTGMINTFHVITYYGTGDPRMMSGGISEALVTTMLGLTVAIPIMLAHTLLSRKIETEIGLMEEKAVTFVNTVFRQQHLNR